MSAAYKTMENKYNTIKTAAKTDNKVLSVKGKVSLSLLFVRLSRFQDQDQDQQEQQLPAAVLLLSHLI